MVGQENRSVGLIGLGRMGLPMARRLAASGFSVAGHDRDRQVAAAASKEGIAIAASPEAVAAASDLVIVVVGFEREVTDVLFGPRGLAERLRPGAVVAIASTAAPSFVIGLAERLAAIGARLIDTPLVRGETAAASGRLVVYAGGAERDIVSFRPVFDVLAERVIRLGDVGAGQVAKAANNQLLWTCVCASAEALDFAAAFGVERDALRAALGYGSGANWALETRADERPALWAEKDLAIVLEEADRAGIAMPVTAQVRQAIARFKRARGLPTPKEEGR
jgi:3-hydroxyisobutyrate dehydrogenase-like beta-hydroxyacid dehydrogenase